MASAGFEVFWAAYPRKVCKKDAEHAWRKIDPAPALAETIIAAVYAQRLDDRERRFIPHPASWLNGERWTDEPTTRGARYEPPRGAWRDRCPHVPTCQTPTLCDLLTQKAASA